MTLWQLSGWLLNFIKQTGGEILSFCPDFIGIGKIDPDNTWVSRITEIWGKCLFIFYIKHTIKVVIKHSTTKMILVCFNF